ncbi:hypothetical protein PR048_007902 [Dryococelus australis]|uniref:Uncharacterized protein n=1 Tax=Dryococelus australis TaxID=614101 RepID=A0ABQ9HVX5_9NEOP|nr:hypothetical protein PR048_007902 [Dryococelus australis]
MIDACSCKAVGTDAAPDPGRLSDVGSHWAHFLVIASLSSLQRDSRSEEPSGQVWAGLAQLYKPRCASVWRVWSLDVVNGMTQPLTRNHTDVNGVEFPLMRPHRFADWLREALALIVGSSEMLLAICRNARSRWGSRCRRSFRAERADLSRVAGPAEVRGHDVGPGLACAASCPGRCGHLAFSRPIAGESDTPRSWSRVLASGEKAVGDEGEISTRRPTRVIQGHGVKVNMKGPEASLLLSWLGVTNPPPEEPALSSALLGDTLFEFLSTRKNDYPGAKSQRTVGLFAGDYAPCALPVQSTECVSATEARPPGGSFDVVRSRGRIVSTRRGCSLHDTYAMTMNPVVNIVVRPLTSHQDEPGSIPGVAEPRIFACGNRAGRSRWSARFLGDLPFPPPLHSGATPSSLRFTLIGYQDLDVKSTYTLISYNIFIMKLILFFVSATHLEDRFGDASGGSTGNFAD